MAQKFIVERLMQFIARFIPNVQLHENFGTEVIFLLPSSERLNGGFTKLFMGLEGNFKQFGIKSYGISDTPLEEVIIKFFSLSHLTCFMLETLIKNRGFGLV